MNARLYDPALGRFLSPDPYVQMPDFTQNFNRYSYCVNNPLIYIDPSGEWFLIDDLIAAVVGGVINLTVNLIQGNVQNFGHGAALFGVGFVGGVASLYVSPLVGAGFVSGSNSILNQGFTNGWKKIDWGQVGISTTMGVATSYLGGQLGNVLAKPISNLTSDITSPVLREALTQGATNAAVGFGLSAGLAWGNGASFEEGLKQGGQGALMGAGIGVMTGTVAGIQYGRDNNVNPWTGKEKGSFSVYEGKDANFDTRYVGITERNPDVRFKEHHNSHGTEKESLDYRVKASGLSKFEARKMEQQLINKYGFGKNGGQLYNKINSISPKYWDKYGIKY